ncbi:MAG: magnesium transporter CorA family protein [Thermodesulfovibrionales bacterium]|nr:magnesium transporter CorA family protein [Thermodesulfovibrionales bacterium]
MENNIYSYIEGTKFKWFNIDTPTQEVLNQLITTHQFKFHPLDLEDCLSKTQLPKIDEYQDYLFIILHFPRYLKDKKFSIPMQVSIFISKEYFVTIHTGELKPINQFFNICKELIESPDSPSVDIQKLNPKSRAYITQDMSTPFLLYRFIYTLVDNLLRMMGKIMINIENIEEKVFDEKIDAVREVTQLRHDIANLRRIIMPLKRVIHELEIKIKRFTDEDMSVYFSDLSDTIDKVWTILDECKETIEIYKDSDFVISSDRTNKILALLTIVFTYSIPATVIGTLYGMNIPMPGNNEFKWTFLGDYTTFFFVLFLSIFPAIMMHRIFKRLKWL